MTFWTGVLTSYRKMSGHKLDALFRVSRLFCQLSLGGPATGLMFGVAMTAWLRFMYNNPMAEITLTVLTAYATYLVGDRLFGVSGVLAVVVLGAMLKPYIAYPHARRNAQYQSPAGLLSACGSLAIVNMYAWPETLSPVQE